tara:strand:+ start:496 stop:3927 length:3432 start_codon:yes stop_codon:yes gene_type:complete
MEIKLEDKYTLTNGYGFLTGSQALVRLPIVQRRRDKKNNLNTAGYISGYRGSPLGNYDKQVYLNRKYLKKHNIHFQPGINEELAATSLWGTQQSNFYGEAIYDGVFGIWYGKGPGVDRSGDALKHANLAGTSHRGGVLALMGDDHICESSSTSHQSEFAMVDAMIPVLHPSGVQEILDYGIYGFELSRISGCWIGIKCVGDNVSSAATVDLNEDRVSIIDIDNTFFPEEGLNIRKGDTPQKQEHRLHYSKLEAVKEFCRINKLNKYIYNSNKAKIGIITTGKSYLDTMQALNKLEIDEKIANKLDIRLLKIAMPWPLEPSIIEEFSKGLYQIIVIEEKRSLIENQIKEILFNKRSSVNIIGKLDIDGNTLFPSSGALNPGLIALKLGELIYNKNKDSNLKNKIENIKNIINEKRSVSSIKRTPYFCSGCPHNTSTQIPDESRAITGISCAYLVQNMERKNEGFAQMGSEGATWVGESVFSNRDHIFQNIGDGTYIHSGILSIRHAVAAKTKITFKILFNDAVALTGGQTLDGSPTVPQISQQLYAEGVTRIAIISDQPEKYSKKDKFSENSKIYHRKDLIKVQIELSKINSTTAIIYDQTCAAEKRRKRKRSLLDDPKKRIYINDLVCEGCGDCGTKSNCVSILPLETEFGRKREIDQFNCNKDYTCVDGFCPSFVSLEGDVKIKKNIDQSLISNLNSELTEPTLPEINGFYGIMITGIGGTGIVSMGALLGTAALFDGKGSGVLDMTGLAQKGGAVKSFVRIFDTPKEISTIKLSYKDTNLLLGCDLLVSNDEDVLLTLDKSNSKAVINSDEVLPGEFTRNPDLDLDSDKIKNNLINILGEKNINLIPTATIAKKILGDTIAANMFIVGYAYQAGLIPITSNSIEKAIKLNNVSVELNLNAFKLGRGTYLKKNEILESINLSKELNGSQKISLNYEEIKKRRFNYLIKYQNKKYAEKYLELVNLIENSEKELSKSNNFLSKLVAINYFKLMAYKDEYEVSRLYTDPQFMNNINENFEGNFKIYYHMAPPIFSKKDPVKGNPTKVSLGPWLFTLMKILSSFKFLRGTIFDPFGYLKERKQERNLIKDYYNCMNNISLNLNLNNYKIACEIASVPEKIRGFGYVKEKNIIISKNLEKELLNKFN